MEAILLIFSLTIAMPFAKAQNYDGGFSIDQNSHGQNHGRERGNGGDRGNRRDNQDN